MRLLIDMNLSPKWVEVLTEAGFEARHWSQIGAAGATDEEILAYAKTHDYVVLTHDLDFGAVLAATRGGKPSVVQTRSGNVSPVGIGASVIAALRQANAELDAGALLTIEVSRSRLRLLPLRLP